MSFAKENKSYLKCNTKKLLTHHAILSIQYADFNTQQYVRLLSNERKRQTGTVK